MIAVELYTLRDQLRDAEAIASGLQRVREMGYEGVELAGLGPIEPARLARLLRDNGLAACSAHIPWDRLRDDLEGVLEDCRTWGCDHVAVPSMPTDYHNADGYARFGGEAGEVARTMKSAGVRLSYHNHSFELERLASETGLERLFQAGGPALGTQLDTYWVQYGGGNPAAWIRRYQGRAPTVHIKDMAVVDGEPVMAEIGEGNLDWTDVLAACQEAGTEVLVVEQDECRGDPFECLAVSRRNLTALGAG
ncbi:MAG: sugar phosphate isomerase/epimerase [Candidatus Dormibacteraeota bacterium]|nr:sugar phosphate isomerase/epimerase [Candidatus Dormibacteraeota bacterium]